MFKRFGVVGSRDFQNSRGDVVFSEALNGEDWKGDEPPLIIFCGACISIDPSLRWGATGVSQNACIPLWFDQNWGSFSSSPLERVLIEVVAKNFAFLKVMLMEYPFGCVEDEPDIHIRLLVASHQRKQCKHSPTAKGTPSRQIPNLYP